MSSRENTYVDRSVSGSRTSSCSRSPQRQAEVFQENSRRAISRGERNTTDYMFGDIHPAVASAISVAAHGILEQHDGYDMRNLSQYVKIAHGQVPEHIVPYIVLSATSAAWYVAHKFYIRERYMNSSQEHHQVMSENIANSMLGWFTGLRPEKMIRSQSSASTRSVNTELEDSKTAKRLSQSLTRSSAEQDACVATSGNGLRSQIENASETCLSANDGTSKSPLIGKQADIVTQSSIVADVEPIIPVGPVIDNSELLSKHSGGSSGLLVHVEQTASSKSVINSAHVEKEVEVHCVAQPEGGISNESTSVPQLDFSNNNENMIPTLSDFLATLTNEAFVDECIQEMTSDSLQTPDMNEVIERIVSNEQSSDQSSGQQLLNLDDYEIDVSIQGIDKYSPSRPQMHYRQNLSSNTFPSSYVDTLEGTGAVKTVNQPMLLDHISKYQFPVSHQSSCVSYSLIKLGGTEETQCDMTVARSNNNESAPETVKPSPLFADMPLLTSGESIVPESQKHSSMLAPNINMSESIVNKKTIRKDAKHTENKVLKVTKKSDLPKPTTKKTNPKVVKSIGDRLAKSVDVVCLQSAKTSSRKPKAKKLGVSSVKDVVNLSTVAEEKQIQKVLSQKKAEMIDVETSDDDIRIVKVVKKTTSLVVPDQVSCKAENSKGIQKKSKINDTKLNEKTTVPLIDVAIKAKNKYRKIKSMADSDMSDVEPDTDKETATDSMVRDKKNPHKSQTTTNEAVGEIKIGIIGTEINHNTLKGSLESFKIPRKSAAANEIPPNVLVELSEQEIEEVALRPTNSTSLLSVVTSEVKVNSPMKNKTQTHDKEVESGYESRSSYDKRQGEVIPRYRPAYSSHDRLYRTQDAYNHRSRSPQPTTYRPAAENYEYQHHNYYHRRNYFQRDENTYPVRRQEQTFAQDYNRNGGGNMVCMTEEERREFRRFMDYRRN